MDTLIQLGDFVFENLEIPEKINFGGDQMLVRHKNIGGVRQIDALGADDEDIMWEGLMYGPTAMQRAQSLNNLRATGQQLTLKWFNLNYQVVIASFKANTEKYYQISYRIALCVISDGANPVTTTNLQGFNEAIQSDLASANNIVSQIVDAGNPVTQSGNQALVNSMAAFTSSINNVNDFTGADAATTNPVVQAADSVLYTIGEGVNWLSLQLFGKGIT